jgi:hypothetical protein
MREESLPHSTDVALPYPTAQGSWGIDAESAPHEVSAIVNSESVR